MTSIGIWNSVQYCLLPITSNPGCQEGHKLVMCFFLFKEALFLVTQSNIIVT